MKTILFFDDFLIHRGADVERRFHTPQWRDEYAYADPNSPYGMGYASVVETPEGGYYLYYVCLSSEETSDEHGSTIVCVAESKDGLTWEPMPTGVAPVPASLRGVSKAPYCSPGSCENTVLSVSYRIVGGER